MTNCLTPQCPRSASQYRGLCMPCYSKAKKYVERGETTWEKLEGMGLAAPDDDPFTKAFNEKKDGDKCQP